MTDAGPVHLRWPDDCGDLALGHMGADLQVDRIETGFDDRQEQKNDEPFLGTRHFSLKL